ncbi:hypothetical protein [Vagococcus sp.]|uniref:hypothetical protein n=1 Tax=Vagococcus sp. TaxID=1933889 RepID=UPI003F97221C
MRYRWKLYISSLLPLFILLIIQNMSISQIGLSLERVMDKEFFQCYSIRLFILDSRNVFWILLLSVTIISIKLTYQLYQLVIKEQNFKTKKYEPKEFFNIFKAEPIEIENVDILNYMFTYIIPMLSLDINSFGSLISNILLLAFVGYIYTKNNYASINIIFLLKKVNVFQINGSYQIITDLTIIDIAENKNGTIENKYNVCELVGNRTVIVKKM